jgi:hypothetical protein
VREMAVSAFSNHHHPVSKDKNVINYSNMRHDISLQIISQKGTFYIMHQLVTTMTKLKCPKTNQTYKEYRIF